MSGSHDEEDHKTTPNDPTRQRRSPFVNRRLAWRPRQQGDSHTSSVERRNNVEVVSKGPLGLHLLHASPEPLIDLIFVHGLKGDSIKTWTRNGDLKTYWPQAWLPMEDGLKNTEIFTFGYDSNWTSSRPSFLNVHDFGQSLLEEMRNAPQLRNNTQRPIILIGHSMGGLIIKKAFILAQNVPDFKTRIRSIFFLSTPHKGNDFASTLNNILALSGILSSRNYLADITTGSASLRSINEGFGRLARDLPIVSFYETLQTKIGVSSLLIVDKDSAVLGSSYRNEKVLLMNADHRSICKYESVDDTNYIRIKNALTGAVESVLQDVSKNKREEFKQQMKALASYLGVSGCPNERYPKVEGSCEWLDARDDFQAWMECSIPLSGSGPDSPAKVEDLAVFWVHANPGTGKTVLASHVFSQLERLELQCACFYFHAGNKISGSLGAFLRSVSYQMAFNNSEIREKLFRLYQDDLTFDMDDSWAIWANVFKKGIFQSQSGSPQYWVIDGLDECHKYQDLFTMLERERPNFPLQIFLTSRNVLDMQRLKKTLQPSSSTFTCFEIPTHNSLHDIRCYIESRIDNLPIDNKHDREDLAAVILRKSNASFLWVRLVLDELETVYSSDTIMEVLDGIPEGMVAHYERTIKAMAANTREKDIAKAVLLWTATGARKLTVSELSQALKLDINALLPSAKSAVQGLCGQLVAVDHETDPDF
ncbi:unnamed protein product [Clonostachys rosea]|uniref:GPI inositol-deacylase n=1 Tax=Bionectria ochroleuca TaxID=29856 RepID=A0ABY6UDL6_BIOOC|nr:unnamed protein product [Clonostachys rosea]